MKIYIYRIMKYKILFYEWPYNFHSDRNLAFLIAIGQVFQNGVLDEVKSLKDKKIHVKFLSLEHYCEYYWFITYTSLNMFILSDNILYCIFASSFAFTQAGEKNHFKFTCI